MPSQIKNIVATWDSYSPDATSGVYRSIEGAEQKINWGVPITGVPRAMGYQSLVAEDQEVILQEEFSLGVFTHHNHPISGGDLEYVNLTLEIEFDRSNFLTLQLQLLVSDSQVRFATGIMPTTIELDNGTIVLDHLEDGDGFHVDDMLTPVSSSGEFTLVVKFLETPTEEAYCAELPPVFNPKRCTIPPICPINPLPLIEDCLIPEAVEQQTDCPELDVQIPALTEITESGSEQGQDGEDGVDGCTPYITVSVETNVVSLPGDVGVSVITTPFGLCSLNIHFIFYLCCGDATTYCCAYVWCNGGWQANSSDPDCVYTEEPPIEGRFEGELVWVCPCTGATTYDPLCDVSDPTSFSASWFDANDPTTVTLTWIGNNGVDESDTCYEIQMSLNDGGSWTTLEECYGEGSGTPYLYSTDSFDRTSRTFRIRGERTGCRPSDWVEYDISSA
jgi:hypothetical protein